MVDTVRSDLGDIFYPTIIIDKENKSLKMIFDEKEFDLPDYDLTIVNV